MFPYLTNNLMRRNACLLNCGLILEKWEIFVFQTGLSNMKSRMKSSLLNSPVLVNWYAGKCGECEKYCKILGLVVSCQKPQLLSLCWPWVLVHLKEKWTNTCIILPLLTCSKCSEIRAESISSWAPLLTVVCVRHKLEGFLPFADLVLGDEIIGSSGNKDYSAANSGPVSWDSRILMSIWSLRGLRCNLDYTQPSSAYLLEITRDF